METVVLWEDDLAPFSSDKIRARILSAAITRTPLPPAGVRIELPAGVRIGPPAGVRIPRDDFYSVVG